MKIENVKGTFDYSGNEQEIREYIKDTLKNVFKLYGYEPLETPIICNFDMLALKYNPDDEILKEVYKVTDQGNRKLGLRYDLTIPFAKFITIQKGLTLPYKRYEIGDVFRDGPVKTGRNRQFVQCDVDVVGLDGANIEEEIISIFIRGMREFNIPFEIKINNRKLMQGIIENLGITNEEDISNVIKAIDKMDKISEEDLSEELLNIGLSLELQKSFQKYFKMNLEELQKEFINTNNVNIKDGLNELTSLMELLNYSSYGKYIKFQPTLARGQEYYTGNIFEVYAIDSGIKSSIGGGGRYDKLITNWIQDGNSYPAVGISFGLNVIYEILKNREEFTNKSLVDLYIIPMNTFKESLKLADTIRNYGYKVEVEMKAKKIKKALDYANKKNIPYVIILGEDEVQKQELNLKNMFTKEQTTISFKSLDNLKNILK